MIGYVKRVPSDYVYLYLYILTSASIFYSTLTLDMYCEQEESKGSMCSVLLYALLVFNGCYRYSRK